MSPFVQAVRVARQLLSEGKTGGDLAEGLHAVVSVLSPGEKKRLASRISREYLILGHAAHDPNMYRTCQAAKEAKESSKDPNLKILTYKTPMCGSCGFNRSARCGLMGGMLIDGPDAVPEKAVHKTADILIANRTLNEGEARLVEMGDGNPTSRVAGLHDRKIKATNFVDDSGIEARIASRRAASILEPAESFEARPKRLVGPARKVNAEALGIGVIDDDEEETTGTDFNDMFGSDMHVDVPADLKDNRSLVGMVDPDTEVDSPSSERTSAEEEDQEVEEEIQASFMKLAALASRMLGEGALTTRIASQIYHKMQVLQENGARHTRKTARIERQIDALGGGMQL